MPDIVVGIDPGAGGAVAILTSAGELLKVHDMPVTLEANGRRATNAALLADLLRESRARRIFCEFVGARPTDAKVAAFAFGRARGVIEGVGGALGVEIVFVAPPVWKRYAGVPPGKQFKDVARSKAIARWPAHAPTFALRKHVDRAEACFIGVAGMARAGRMEAVA